MEYNNFYASIIRQAKYALKETRYYKEKKNEFLYGYFRGIFTQAINDGKLFRIYYSKYM